MRIGALRGFSRPFASATFSSDSCGGSRLILETSATCNRSRISSSRSGSFSPRHGYPRQQDAQKDLHSRRSQPAWTFTSPMSRTRSEPSRSKGGVVVELEPEPGAIDEDNRRRAETRSQSSGRGSRWPRPAAHPAPSGRGVLDGIQLELRRAAYIDSKKVRPAWRRKASLPTLSSPPGMSSRVTNLPPEGAADALRTTSPYRPCTAAAPRGTLQSGAVRWPLPRRRGSPAPLAA